MKMTIFLYLMYFVTTCLSVYIILSKNPVIAVIFLIIIYCSVSAVFIVIGAEFIALLLIIIYAGAISVLFLFVVMMLNVRLLEIRNTLFTHIPICGLIGSIFMLQIMIINFYNIKIYSIYDSDIYIDWIYLYNAETDIALLGQLLINYYFIFLLLAGVVLLLAMVGSIALTLDHFSRIGIKCYDTTRIIFLGVNKDINLYDD